METFNNTTKVVRDDLAKKIKSGSKLSIAAACFSIYAYQALKEELESCDELRFIFTSPTCCRKDTERTPGILHPAAAAREKPLWDGIRSTSEK